MASECELFTNGRGTIVFCHWEEEGSTCGTFLRDCSLAECGCREYLLSFDRVFDSRKILRWEIIVEWDLIVYTILR